MAEVERSPMTRKISRVSIDRRDAPFQTSPHGVEVIRVQRLLDHVRTVIEGCGPGIELSNECRDRRTGLGLFIGVRRHALLEPADQGQEGRPDWPTPSKHPLDE